MSSYHQLLEATVKYLESLKVDGVGAVSVRRETLAALASPPPKLERPISRASVTPPAAKPAHPAPAPIPVRATQPLVPSELSIETAPLEGIAKDQAFGELRTRTLVCQKCPHLASSRRNVVFGVGDINSPLMFVGEAPGSDEDAQGEPFVGKAGQLLTRMIQAMNLSRERVYIANVLKCRPDTPGQAYGNRRPTPDEMRTCLPYLREQIQIIRPKVIVALGAVAVEGLFGKPTQITRSRGQFLQFQNIPVMLTYHPAYLLRNQQVTEKRKVWEDLMQVMERLALPITEKQRGFFLKG